MITINLDKAKDITKDRLRRERKPLLEAEDIKFMQSQESGADTTAIVSKKQALRDAPAASAIGAASTPAALRAAWDTTLLGTTPYKS